MLKMKIFKSGVHLGEEKLIAGNSRAGMIVFSGCHLSCSFCYTPETSVYAIGSEYEDEDFLLLLRQLMNKGAQNINLISPTHVWNQIEDTLIEFKKETGGKLPIVIKASGYETRSLLSRMASVGDLFIPDFKVESEIAATHFNLPRDYGKVTLWGIRALMQSHGASQYDAEGKLRRGILVRHLVLPGFAADSQRVIHALGKINFSGYVNLMTRFVDPVKRILIPAPASDILALVHIAESRGIGVLINGTPRDEYAFGSEEPTQSMSQTEEQVRKEMLL